MIIGLNNNLWRGEEDPTNPPLSRSDTLYVAGTLLLIALSIGIMLHLVFAG